MRNLIMWITYNGWWCEESDHDLCGDGVKVPGGLQASAQDAEPPLHHHVGFPLALILYTLYLFMETMETSTRPLFP
jgi:hypothetical protein